MGICRNLNEPSLPKTSITDLDASALQEVHYPIDKFAQVRQTVKKRNKNASCFFRDLAAFSPIFRILFLF